MLSGSLMPKESPELADVRTKILRGLLRVMLLYIAQLSPAPPWTKNTRVTNISYVTASLNIRAGMCIPDVQEMQLVVRELQRAPGCYNIHNSFTFYGLAYGPKDISLLLLVHMYHFWDFRHTIINLSPYSIFWRLKLKLYKNAHNLHPSLSHTPRDTAILNYINIILKKKFHICQRSSTKHDFRALKCVKLRHSELRSLHVHDGITDPTKLKSVSMDCLFHNER
jgi:hypothetical protein